MGGNVVAMSIIFRLILGLLGFGSKVFSFSVPACSWGKSFVYIPDDGISQENLQLTQCDQDINL